MKHVPVLIAGGGPVGMTLARTLALDFRNNRAATTLFSRLDEIVRAAGGRLYPAKDARMPRALYEATYTNLGAFTAHRDPGMSSGLSRRLMGS